MKLFIAAPPVPAGQNAVQDVADTRADDSPEARQAFEVAVAALNQPGWAEAFPYFRKADDCPVMERYHAKNEWHPLQLTELAKARLENRDGHQWVILTAKTERHRSIVLALEKTAESWKVDWEALADAPGFEWQEFYQQLRRLRSTCAWKPSGIGQRCLHRHRRRHAQGRAARELFLPPSERLRHRPGRQDSDLGRKLDAQLQWDTPLRIVADLSRRRVVLTSAGHPAQSDRGSLERSAGETVT